jgi:hypothetical protein
LAASGLRQQLFFPNRNVVGKEPLRQQPNFAISLWILGCWRKFLSRQQSFPLGKEFLRQQLRPWLLGKLWVVGEATVSYSDFWVPTEISRCIRLKLQPVLILVLRYSEITIIFCIEACIKPMGHTMRDPAPSSALEQRKQRDVLHTEVSTTPLLWCVYPFHLLLNPYQNINLPQLTVFLQRLMVLLFRKFM